MYLILRHGFASQDRLLGMTSANALVLGEARWKLAHPICGNLRQFSMPQPFSLDWPFRTGWLDGFAVPALVVEPAEAQRRLVL